MNKPDGITQDAWERAREVGLNAYLNEFYVTEIARAIQSSVEAERSRCASYHEQQVRRHENSKLAISERAQEWGVQAMDRQASLIADVSIEIHRDAISAIRKGA